MLGIAVVAIAVVVVTTILLTADIEEASDFVEVLLVGVSLAVAAVPEGLPAILSVVLALGVQRMARRTGDREAAVIRRDVGLGVGRVLGQDRHPHEERDDDREDRHRIGRGGRDRIRLPAGRRAAGRRPPARRPCAPRGGAVGVARGQPGQRRRAARGRRRVDDPGRSHRGGVPRRRGQDRDHRGADTRGSNGWARSRSRRSAS